MWALCLQCRYGNNVQANARKLNLKIGIKKIENYVDAL